MTGVTAGTGANPGPSAFRFKICSPAREGA